jgi:hypothetical protein
MVQGKPGQVGDELERQLFIVRKLVERAALAAMGAAAEDFYVCTLSNRTIVYKVRVGWRCGLGGLPSVHCGWMSCGGQGGHASACARPT